MNSVANNLNKSGSKLDGKSELVMHSEYCPELYVSPVFSDDQESYYNKLIGFLMLGVKLGHIDINVGVDLLSCYLDQHRKVNLNRDLHNFYYI